MMKLRLGVIGTGIAFRSLHLPNFARHKDRVEVVGLTSRTAESRDSAASLVADAMGRAPDVAPNIESLLMLDLDAVLVNVPIALTREIALQVLDAGHNLVCEKPLGESADEGAEIVRKAEMKGCMLAVCENFRYQKRFADVEEAVRSGTIGEPRAYMLNDLHYTSPTGTYAVTGWRQRGDHRGGYLLDGGSHIVAGMRAMVGATPESVHALPASFHPGHLGRPWDTALVNMVFPSGMVGHLALGYGTPDREARHPKIFGTTGTIVLKKGSIEIWRDDPAQDESRPLDDNSDGISAEWDNFVPALGGIDELRFDAWEAVADLAVIDAILASAETGTPTKVRRYGSADCV
jgi:predicted dehydrogenase